VLPQAKQLAIVHTYNELVAVLRSRAEELHISGDTLESAAGLPARYSSKLLCPTPVKNLGPSSLGALLNTLRLELVVRAKCTADEAFEAIRPDIRKRREDSQVRHRRKRA
jgi:hypothetical protein